MIFPDIYMPLPSLWRFSQPLPPELPWAPSGECRAEQAHRITTSNWESQDLCRMLLTPSRTFQLLSLDPGKRSLCHGLWTTGNSPTSAQSPLSQSWTTLWGPGIPWQRAWALPGPTLAWICPSGGQTTTLCTPSPRVASCRSEQSLDPGAAGHITGVGEYGLEADAEAEGQHPLECSSELQAFWEFWTQAWPSESLWTLSVRVGEQSRRCVNSLLAWPVTFN